MSGGLDVIVIGAGVAGVTAARELRRAGAAVRLLEARRRLGGRILTVRDFCEAPVEAGAELVHGSAARIWPDVRAAGLHVRPSPHTRGAMIAFEGRARLLWTALLDPRTWPAFTVLRDVRRAASRSADMSVADLIRERGYRGRARLIAEMALATHPPGPPSEIGVQGFVADGALTLETGHDHRIDEGYDRLVEHIGAGLDVEYDAAVALVEWSNSGVALQTADGRNFRAHAAVCTLPAGVVRSGAVRFAPALPAQKLRAFEGIITGSVLKILLRFAHPFWPRGLATLLCAAGPVNLYWNVFYGRENAAPVLSAYCTGRRALLLQAMPEEQKIEIVLADLRRAFPGAQPELVALRCVDWSADPLAGGGYSFLRTGARDARAGVAAPDTGMLFWAGAETATQPIAATVDGAFTSGLRAAGEVIRALDGRPQGPSQA